VIVNRPYPLPLTSRGSVLVSAPATVDLFSCFGERGGLFHVLAPIGMSSADRPIWRAGVTTTGGAGGNHLLGFLRYFLLAWFAM